MSLQSARLIRLRSETAKMNSRHVLIYTMNFWPEQVGIGKMSSELAHYLAKAGWNVSVVTSLPHQPGWEIYRGYQGKFFFSRENWEGIQIKRSRPYVPHVPQAGLMRAWKRIASDTSMPLTGLLPALLGPRPDLIISVPTPLQAAAAAIFLKTIWGCPILNWVQDLIPDVAVQTGMVGKGKAFLLARRLEDFVHRHADCIAVISDGFERNLAAKGVDSSKIVKLPNWIDLKRFDQPSDRNEIRRRFGISSGFVLIHVGSVAARTGASTLLSSMSLLRDRPEIELVFVGGGNQRRPIEESAKALGLGRVRFLGEVERQEDVIDLVFAADLTVLSQKATVTDSVVPSKLLTYMAGRRPVLASVNPESEAASVIRISQGGMVTAPENEMAFADAILFLQREAGLRSTLGEAGRSYVEQYCEYSQVLGKFEAVLRSLLASRPGTRRSWDRHRRS
jgi:colanic acid biosynthesis glycosyl transferase WcaI